MFDVIDEVFQGFSVNILDDVRLGVVEFQHPFEDSFFMHQIAFVDSPELVSVEG